MRGLCRRESHLATEKENTMPIDFFMFFFFEYCVWIQNDGFYKEKKMRCTF